MSELVRTATPGIRARLRPRAVLWLWAWEALLGLLVGSSVASVASGAYGQHPTGDLSLFAPGGLELLDLLRHSAAARGPVLTMVVFVVVVARVGGLVPSTAVLAELAFTAPDRRSPPLRDALGRGMGALPASLAVAVLTLAVQAAVLVCGVAFATAASGVAFEQLGEPAGDKLAVAILLLAAAFAGVTGIVLDIARAAIVRNERGALDAVDTSLAVFRARPLALTGSYAWRALASWIPVAIAGALTTFASPVERHATAGLLAIAAIHQLVIAVRVAIRTSWMARTLRALG